MLAVVGTRVVCLARYCTVRYGLISPAGGGGIMKYRSVRITSHKELNDDESAMR